MAYVAVEADERLDELESDIKTLSQPPAGDIGDPAPRGGQGRGYISDASNASFWNIDYYQHHFDVDTKTVGRLSLYQHTQSLLAYLHFRTPSRPLPDLYGPFWTLTTLIFTLFITSSLAHSIVSYLSSDPVEYDFALLSTAVGLVYVYGIGVPVMLWVALRYAGISENWFMVEAMTVWGYAMFRFALSGYFLVANVYPVLVSADQKPVRLMIVVIAVLHAVVALLFKVLFFSYYVETNIGPADPTL
ncbi:Yip1-domain-containing protein [Russula emetica]|nr:Yip1-domain-containing protein [Russula emetica]